MGGEGLASDTLDPYPDPDRQQQQALLQPPAGRVSADLLLRMLADLEGSALQLREDRERGRGHMRCVGGGRGRINFVNALEDMHVCSSVTQL